jgi:protein SCO1/2
MNRARIIVLAVGRGFGRAIGFGRAVGFVLAVGFASAGACGSSGGQYVSPLERIGPAAPFRLTTQDGEILSLEQLRGKVVVVTFVFTTCSQGCSPLTAKLAAVAEELESEARSDVFMVFVTLTPERDTPEVLRGFAEIHGLDLDHSAFLTGTPEQIRDVARAYGVVYHEAEGGEVEHTFVTSLIDRAGGLRVQYLGTRFDPDELLGDVLGLVKEAA